jgi:hypothetical protein
MDISFIWFTKYSNKQHNNETIVMNYSMTKRKTKQGTVHRAIFRQLHLVTVILLWEAIALVLAFPTLSAATLNQVYVTESAVMRTASSIKHPAQETGVSNKILRTVTKLLKPNPYKATVVHTLQLHDQDARLNLCNRSLQWVGILKTKDYQTNPHKEGKLWEPIHLELSCIPDNYYAVCGRMCLEHEGNVSA